MCLFSVINKLLCYGKFLYSCVSFLLMYFVYMPLCISLLHMFFYSVEDYTTMLTAVPLFLTFLPIMSTHRRQYRRPLLCVLHFNVVSLFSSNI